MSMLQDVPSGPMVSPEGSWYAWNIASTLLSSLLTALCTTEHPGIDAGTAPITLGTGHVMCRMM